MYMAMNARNNLQGSDIGPVVHGLNSQTYCAHWVLSKQLVDQYSAGTSTSYLLCSKLLAMPSKWKKHNTMYVAACSRLHSP